MELEERARDSADNCIACTSCIAVCPVTKANPDYRGPKLVGPAHNRMHFSDESDYEDSLKLCSNCKNCDITCPNGVSVATLNMLERAKYYKAHPEKHTQADQMLSHNFQMADMLKSIPFGRTCANIGMSIGEAMGMMGAMGIAPQRKSPRFATKYFREMYKEIKQPEGLTKEVLFFPGCFIDVNDPEVGVAFVKVMNANGYKVLMDDRFKCCGSPLVVGGYLDEARSHADNNVAIINEYAAKNIPVIACCTSCSLMLKAEYTELFAQEEMAQAAAAYILEKVAADATPAPASEKQPTPTEDPKVYYDGLADAVLAGEIGEEEVEDLLRRHFEGAENSEELVQAGLAYIREKLQSEATPTPEPSPEATEETATVLPPQEENEGPGGGIWIIGAAIAIAAGGAGYALYTSNRRKQKERAAAAKKRAAQNRMSVPDSRAKTGSAANSSAYRRPAAAGRDSGVQSSPGTSATSGTGYFGTSDRSSGAAGSGG